MEKLEPWARVRIAYHVEDLGTMGSCRSANFGRAFNNLVGTSSRAARIVRELAEAERVVEHTWQMFEKEQCNLFRLVRDHSEQQDDGQAVNGFDEEWYSTDPRAKVSLFVIEVYVSALLNHVYIVSEKIALLSRVLFEDHCIPFDSCLTASSFRGKKWKEHVFKSLASRYAPQVDGCPSTLVAVQKLLRLRNKRVHEKHLYAHVVKDGDTWRSAFQYHEQLGQEPYTIVLDSKELVEGLDHLQCFLQWYVAAADAAVSPAT